MLALIIGIGAGLVLGALIGWLFARLRRTSGDGEDPAVLQARHEVALAELRAVEQSAKAALAAELASAQATATALKDQVGGLQDQHKEFTERQRTEQAAQQERERAESKVLQMLTPVRETIQTMQQKVTELEKERSTQYGSISEQLTQTRISGEQIRATAESLASALRNNATRGVWGEAQLRNVVEAAGLTNRVDFQLQSTIDSDAGRGRPDMVVNLPGGMSIAVDAKVPFDSYLEASAIPLTASDEELARRKGLLEKHVKAVRSHIDALASKTYWDGLDTSPEFVVAFIPSESLLSAALEADSSLLDYSFRKRIALASPVNLWAVLKTVALTWQQELLTEDAQSLLNLSQRLYDRISTMAGHADSLRGAIERTVKSYNDFASSLETRVLVTARQINRLDEGKILGEARLIETAPATLTAPELTASDTADHNVVDETTET